MTELEIQTRIDTLGQEVHNRNARIVERRKEMLQRMNVLTRKPERDWTLSERIEIRRLFIMLQEYHT